MRSAEQIRAGALGLKLHEDWGTTPAAIDRCLVRGGRVRRAGGDSHRHAQRDRLRGGHHRAPFAAARSTPTTPRAPAAVTRPTSSGCAASRTSLPSSTNPTMPFTRNTLDEHLDMLMVCHHLSPSVPEDVAFADSRIRPETIAAEDVLHDLGAFSMMSSDSQAMGRIGEVICRTWQTADKMKRQRGTLPGESAGPRQPASAALHREHARSTRPSRTASRRTSARSTVGKMADLVLWKPAFFGVKPELIIKGRIHRRRDDGRRQRVDSDTAAGRGAPDVRRLRRRAGWLCGAFHQSGRSRRGRAGDAGAAGALPWPGAGRSARRIWC